MQSPEPKSAEGKLPKSEELFQRLVETIKDYAICVLDPKGNIIGWNKGGEHLLGYRESEIIGKNFSMLFTPEDRKKGLPEDKISIALTIGRADDEHWIVKKDGSKFWGLGVTTQLLDKNDHLLGLAKVIKDMTEHREMERRKDEFISIASHELKTPVTTVKGYVQLLQKHLDGDKKASFYLAHVDDEINRLTTLIADLLDVSKIRGGKLQLRKERFLIDDIAREVAEDLQNTTSQHKISIRGKTTKKVYADRYRISQVLINLISNAIKFSPRADRVIISLSEDREGVLVAVRDFGIGIAKKNLGKIFERFYQANTTIRQSASGLGLGLYISSQIISRHGGKIWAESEKGKGSLFTFNLPFKNEGE